MPFSANLAIFMCCYHRLRLLFRWLGSKRQKKDKELLKNLWQKTLLKNFCEGSRLPRFVLPPINSSCCGGRQNKEVRF